MLRNSEQYRQKKVIACYKNLAATFEQLELYDEALTQYLAMRQVFEDDFPLYSGQIRHLQEELEDIPTEDRSEIEYKTTNNNIKVGHILGPQSNHVKKVIQYPRASNSSSISMYTITTSDKCYIQGVGTPFKVVCADSIMNGDLIIHNPGEKVILTGDLSKIRSITADVGTLIIQSDLEISENFKIHTTGTLVIDKGHKISSSKGIDVQAENVVLSGELKSDQELLIDAKESLLVPSTGRLHSKKLVSVTAKNLPTMRGKITSNNALSITGSIDARGNGLIEAQSKLFAFGQHISASGKAKINCPGEAQLILENSLVVNENSTCTAGKLKIDAVTCKNYGSISANELDLRATDTTTNYQGAILDGKQKLKLSGGNVFNRGDIKHGQEKSDIRLNGLFVHGVSDLSELLSLPHSREELEKIAKRANLSGSGPLNIVAAGYVNIASWLSATRYTLSCLAEINLFGVEQTTSESKARFLAADYSLSVVNIPALFESIKNFSFPDKLNASMLADKMLSGLYFVGWVVKRFIPALNKMIDMGLGVISTLRSLPTLMRQLTDLYNRSTPTEPCDFIELLQLTNCVVTQAVSAGVATELGIEQLTGIGLGPVEFKSIQNAGDVAALSLDTLALAGGTSTKTAIAETSGSATVNFNVSERHFYSNNTDAIAALNVFSSFLEKNEHSAILANNYAEVGKDLNLGSAVAANTVSINVENLQTNATKMSVDFVQTQARKIDIGKETHIAMRSGVMQATEQMDDHGELAADESLLLSTRNLDMDPESHTRAETLAVKATEGAPAGHITARKLATDIDKLPDVDKLVQGTGGYENIEIKDQLTVKTQTPFRLNNEVNKNYSITVSAPTVDINAPVTSTGDLTFVATEGNERVTAALKSSGKTALHSNKKVIIEGANVTSKKDNDIRGKEGVDVLPTVTTQTTQQSRSADDVDANDPHALPYALVSHAIRQAGDPNPEVHRTTTTTEVRSSNITSETGNTVVASANGEVNITSSNIHSAQSTVLGGDKGVTIDSVKQGTRVTETLANIEKHPDATPALSPQLHSSNGETEVVSNVSSGEDTILASAHGPVTNNGNPTGKNVLIYAHQDVTNNRLLSATEKLEVESDADIINNCKVTTVPGPFGGTKEIYDPAVMQAGSGGIHAHARRKVKSNAGNWHSNGNMEIKGDQGVEMNHLEHTYTSDRQNHRSLFTEYQSETETTQTQVSQFVSTNGSITIESKEGEVTGTAPVIASAKGNHLEGAAGTHLKGLPVKEVRHESTDVLGGLISHEETTQTDESTIPAILAAKTGSDSSVASARRDVELDDTLAIGDNLTLNAPNGAVRMKNSINRHEAVRKSHGFSFGVPLASKINSVIQNGITPQQLAAFLPVISDVSNLQQTENAETILAAANLIADAANTLKTASAISQGGLSQAIPAPEVKLAYSNKEENRKWETPGPARTSLNGTLTVKAKEFDIEGVPITAQNLKVTAPLMKVTGQALNSFYQASEQSVSLGLSSNGLTVGASFSDQEAQQINHVRDLISIEQKVELHVQELELHDALIDVDEVTGEDIRKLFAESHADTFSGESTGFNVQTSLSNPLGLMTTSIGYTHASQQAANLAAVSGIHAHKKLDLHVHEATLKGSEVTSDGETNFHADSKIEETVEQYEEKHFVDIQSERLKNSASMLAAKETTSLPDDLQNEAREKPETEVPYKQHSSHFFKHQVKRETSPLPDYLKDKTRERHDENKNTTQPRTTEKENKHQSTELQELPNGATEVLTILIEAVANDVEELAYNRLAPARSWLKPAANEAEHVAKYLQHSAFLRTAAKLTGIAGTTINSTTALVKIYNASPEERACVALQTGVRYLADSATALTTVAVIGESATTAGAGLVLFPAVALVAKGGDNLSEMVGNELCTVTPKPSH